jgi:hypothetical protein
MGQLRSNPTWWKQCCVDRNIINIIYKIGVLSTVEPEKYMEVILKYKVGKISLEIHFQFRAWGSGNAVT